MHKPIAISQSTGEKLEASSKIRNKTRMPTSVQHGNPSGAIMQGKEKTANWKKELSLFAEINVIIQKTFTDSTKKLELNEFMVDTKFNMVRKNS